jgi:hypothetical protein
MSATPASSMGMGARAPPGRVWGWGRGFDEWRSCCFCRRRWREPLQLDEWTRVQQCRHTLSPARAASVRNLAPLCGRVCAYVVPLQPRFQHTSFFEADLAYSPPSFPALSHSLGQATHHFFLRRRPRGCIIFSGQPPPLCVGGQRHSRRPEGRRTGESVGVSVFGGGWGASCSDDGKMAMVQFPRESYGEMSLHRRLVLCSTQRVRQRCVGVQP